MADLIFVGGSDTLQLEDGGKVYRPGDVIPRLSQERRILLQNAGIRFTTRHVEPTVTPDGKPAEMAAAEHLPDGAVVAAIEAAPVEPSSKPRRAAPAKE